MPDVQLPAWPDLSFEECLRADGHGLIAGVDEVGRGSLAGPVVAAAVILPPGPHVPPSLLGQVRDSKQLLPVERAALFPRVVGVALAVGIGWASHHAVDGLGLSAANALAMGRAVGALPTTPDALLLDFFHLPRIDLPQLAIKQGDARSVSIAAASIVAKVVRDGWMSRYDARFPQYGFAANKGYGTRQHREALQRFGPCPLHRRSFAPVQRSLA